MKVAPFRALTQFETAISAVTLIMVEMKVAPFRALTHMNCPDSRNVPEAKWK